MFNGRVITTNNMRKRIKDSKVFSQKDLYAIIQDEELTRTELRLFMWLVGKSGADGSVNLELAPIADALGLSKSSISTALKGLVQRNIVLRRDHSRYDRSPLPEEFIVDYDQINYRLAFNDKIENYLENIDKYPEIQIKCGDHKWMSVDTGLVVAD